MTQVKLDSARYNKIPEQWFNGIETLLEVGCNDGYAQINSTHSKFFKKVTYTGIDIAKINKTYLDNIYSPLDFGIAKFLHNHKFQCILCLHVLEHIEEHKWPYLLDKMWNLLSDNGILIIGTPYQQSTNDYVHRDIDYGHVVFDITEKNFEGLLPQKCFIRLNKVDLFRGDDINIIKAILRKLKRVIIRHPYRKNQTSILIKWHKGDF